MEDRVKLTADDSDYQNVMRRAGQTADQFTKRIDRASHGFTSLFKRSPDRRAELAISNLAGSLASGDLAGAVTSFAGRLSGIGLAAGVGVGVAAEVFEKFHKQIEETKQAHEALLVEMGKRPVSLVTSLSSEGMEQALDTRIKLGEDLAEKAKHTLGSEIAETFKSLLVGPTFGAIGGKDNGKERLQQQQDLNKNEADKKAIMEGQARLAEKLVAIRKQELEGDEHAAEIAKAALQTDQARAALHLKFKDNDVAFRTAEKALLSDEELSFHQADKKANAKEAQLKFEERLVALQRKGLVGDDLKKVRASLEIRRLDEEIAAERSPQARRELRLERAQKVNEAGGLFPAAPSNPFPFGTGASRDFERQFGFSGFTRRGIEDSLGFGGLARRSIDRGESLTPEEALLKSGTSADDIAAFKKNVGDLPGTDSKSQDVVGAVQHLETELLKAWQ